MGKAKKTRKFAVAKKMISPKDTRVRENLEKSKKKEEEEKKKKEPKQVEQAVSSLFFQYNTQLGPPYHILVDTNFINFSIRYVPFLIVGAWAWVFFFPCGRCRTTLNFFCFLFFFISALGDVFPTEKNSTWSVQ